SYASKVWIRTAAPPQKPATYEQACQILGVTRRDSLETIKRAYRKQVSACHPDKLAQQKLTPSEVAMAKDRLLRYQQAWELIRQRHRTLYSRLVGRVFNQALTRLATRTASSALSG